MDFEKKVNSKVGREFHSVHKIEKTTKKRRKTKQKRI
jgi:hypothetical protein